jgi:alpha-glucosidase/alpha-D-xyloside xylohydrolase
LSPKLSRRDLLKGAALVGVGAGLKARTAAATTRGLKARTTSATDIVQSLRPAPTAGVVQAFTPASTIAGRPVQIVVTSASPVTARISILAVENGRLQTIPTDGALDARIPASPPALVTESRVDSMHAGDLTIHVSADPMTIRINGKDGRPVQQLHIDSETGAMRFPLGDGALLGLGEGGPQFDRRGSADRMRSGQGGYQLRTHGGRVPVPWLIGTAGWAMFIHQPFGTFDFTGTEGKFDPGASPLPLDLFIVGAREPAAIMAEYAKLTGYPEMPPLWSFGYQQSHRTLASREEILQEAKTFRDKKLPCDTLIYLGTGFCPSGWNTDNGEFAFNRNVFPDPPEMLRQLHADHFKIVLHVVLEGRKLTGTVNDPCTAPPLPSGKTADGRWPDDRQVSCYWPVHKAIFDLGVDGWWPDQGDGLDGPSRLARNRMYWDGSRAWRPNERPFALHRNGYPGMQRYAAFLWSGDVYSTWETLKTHVPVAVNTGLSGIPYWGTDIGGFVPTKEFTGELYVRWFQFGAFCPLFRSHGRTWKLRLPWGWNTGELGPNEVANYTGGAANPDASELHNAAVEPICRKFLELRYRLLPYTYAAVRAAHETGLPIVRALWLHYPADRTATTRGDEYLWGRDILVAPVVEQGAVSRSVYLPAGRWYDFWTEEALEGGREVSRRVDLSTMPLLVRAGAIVPLGPVKQYTSEQIDAPLAVFVYPGADGAFTLYEDDGVTFEYQRGDWMGIEMRWDDRQRRLALRLANGSRMRAPNSRRMQVRMAGSRDLHDVVFTGAPVDIRF